MKCAVYNPDYMKGKWEGELERVIHLLFKNIFTTKGDKGKVIMA